MEKILRSSAVAGARRLTYGKEKPENTYRRQDASDTLDESGHQTPASVTADELVHDDATSQLYSTQAKLAELLRKNEDLAQANQELEAKLASSEKQAYEEAKARGYEAGQAESKEEIADLIDQFSALLERIESNSESTFNELKSQALDIGFAVACKVLGETLVTEEGVKAAVSQVCSSIREASRLKIFVSPRDYELLKNIENHSVGEGAASIELVSDNRISIGGCRVESDMGGWDGRLESQLRILRQKLEGLSEGMNS
ncbi:FliH/SctL family protein [Hahella ganghwensis]|uniref:FliH/SctL family protein n=1 Tax=Hahella ganghwensis TaxID=286420 RepID=UPI0003685925|nr:FliH/SctL family protein [Hahella ganghwensis]